LTGEIDERHAMRPKGGMAATSQQVKRARRQEGKKARRQEGNETPRKMIYHTGATLVRVSPASCSGEPHG
jgi:hypothetical protein